MTASLPRLPERPVDAHKGQFGRVQIIGGSIGMAGAPALAALAALRSGAGLVQVACPREVRTAVATLVPCATIGQFYEADKFNPTVRAVGPGCGDSLTSKDLKWILSEGRTPVVLDADGLNVLARIDEWWSQIDQNDVLTPHSGEMKRLLEKTSLDAAELKRPDLARDVARLCGGIVVLKGHETVVSDGEKSYILAPQALSVGQWIESGPQSEIHPGNCLPLRSIPTGTVVHNLELTPQRGGQLVRSAGSGAQVLSREGEYVLVRLPSGEMRRVLLNCRATIGQLSNPDHKNESLGKAGARRHMGRRPHGGGEGRSPIGMPGPKSPTGQPTLGHKTRKKHKASSKFIVRRGRRR